MLCTYVHTLGKGRTGAEPQQGRGHLHVPLHSCSLESRHAPGVAHVDDPGGLGIHIRWPRTRRRRPRQPQRRPRQRRPRLQPHSLTAQRLQRPRLTTTYNTTADDLPGQRTTLTLPRFELCVRRTCARPRPDRGQTDARPRPGPRPGSYGSPSCISPANSAPAPPVSPSAPSPAQSRHQAENAAANVELQ